MQTYIDIGLNLTDKQFAKDRDEVIQRALNSGVRQMIVTVTNVKESHEALGLEKKYPGVLYATAGIHPHNAKQFQTDSIDELKKLAENNEVVAIGECGLDFNRMFSPQEIQEECFEAQLELAKNLSMPLFFTRAGCP